MLPHHDQQASEDRNQPEHGRMLSSNTLPLNLTSLIEVTFSTPTPVCNSYQKSGPLSRTLPANLQFMRLTGSPAAAHDGAS